MRLALSFFPSFYSFSLPIPPLLSFLHPQNNTHTLSSTFIYLFIYSFNFILLLSFTFDPKSLFSNLNQSCSIHLSSFIFNLSPSCFTHEQDTQQSTFFAMFTKTALLCALFAASAQVAVTQAVVEPACFMKVFSYESYFNIKFAV